VVPVLLADVAFRQESAPDEGPVSSRGRTYSPAATASVMVLPEFFKTLAHRGWREIRTARLRARMKGQRRRVATVLTSEEPPDCSAAEAAFGILQSEYAGVPEYGYDAYSTWRRGAQRALALLGLVRHLRTPGARVLEAGCGDGVTGWVLSGFGHHVTLTDLEDWRDDRVRPLRFEQADISAKLPFEGEEFELCITYNSFEHFSSPPHALQEMIRVLKPGGWLFAEFGPLYAGPWGLHAYRSLRMPYPQFLFSEPYWRARLHELGIWDLNASREDLQPLNRWRAIEFRRLWDASGCRLLHYEEGPAESHLSLIERFPRSFSGRGLTLEDVSTQSIAVLLQKEPIVA
jgi:SAM-dependent methyltransferase